MSHPHIMMWFLLILFFHTGHGGSSGQSGSDEGYGKGNWGHGGSVGYLGDAGHHDGKYVAINRGSIHVAPLVGHTQSVS